MKGFVRTNTLFSLCGLNCGLCPMNLAGHCPGCGGGSGNQSCSIAKCSLTHEGIAYCFQCPNFPCSFYVEQEPFDSFITYQNRLKDMNKAMEIGTEAYNQIQKEKRALLRDWLENWNDGRHKTLFCVAVNLLELDELQGIMAVAEKEAGEIELDSKARAFLLAELLHESAQSKDLVLFLRKKPLVEKKSQQKKGK